MRVGPRLARGVWFAPTNPHLGGGSGQRERTATAWGVQKGGRSTGQDHSVQLCPAYTAKCCTAHDDSPKPANVLQACQPCTQKHGHGPTHRCAVHAGANLALATLQLWLSWGKEDVCQHCGLARASIMHPCLRQRPWESSPWHTSNHQLAPLPLLFQCPLSGAHSPPRDLRLGKL